MVGFEGDRPVEVVRTTRVKAVNPNYPALIKREVDVLPKQDGRDWSIGDEIGLNGVVWTERNTASVYAVITEIVYVSD